MLKRTVPLRRLLLRLERFRRNPKLAPLRNSRFNTIRDAGTFLSERVLKRPSVHAVLLDPAGAAVRSNIPLVTQLAQGVETMATRRRRLLIEQHGSPQISVIMAARNAQDTVREAITSVLEQSYGKLELIVVDDSSSDDTVAIVRSMAAQDPRIVVTSNPGQNGAARARNVGLAMAVGDYVTFQDSDDISHVRRLEHQLAKLLEYPEAVVCRCNSQREDDQGHVVAINGRRVRLAVIAMMFERERVLSRLGYFDGGLPVSEDSEYFERMCAMFGAQSAVSVLRTLYFQRYAPTSLLFSDGTTETGRSGGVWHQRSEEAEEALRRFRAKHRLMKNGEMSPFVPFN
jgi:hypothetical protein